MSNPDPVVLLLVWLLWAFAAIGIVWLAHRVLTVLRRMSRAREALRHRRPGYLDDSLYRQIVEEAESITRRAAR